MPNQNFMRKAGYNQYMIRMDTAKSGTDIQPVLAIFNSGLIEAILYPVTSITYIYTYIPLIYPENAAFI